MCDEKYIFVLLSEIPLFHVLNARVTFGNIFALNENVQSVQPIKDETTVACVVDDNCFEPPLNYKRIGIFRLIVRLLFVLYLVTSDNKELLNVRFIVQSPALLLFLRNILEKVIFVLNAVYYGILCLL